MLILDVSHDERKRTVIAVAGLPDLPLVFCLLATIQRVAVVPLVVILFFGWFC